MAHTILHKVRGVALTRVVEETDILFSHRNPTALKSKGVPEGGPDIPCLGAYGGPVDPNTALGGFTCKQSLYSV